MSINNNNYYVLVIAHYFKEVFFYCRGQFILLCIFWRGY